MCAILDSVPPESPDSTSVTVAGCIGVALGLLDDWLSGHDTQAPPGLAQHSRLPAGHWRGERAATDILYRRQRTSVPLPRRADHSAMRPADPLRSRARVGRRHRNLGSSPRHPTARTRPHRCPLTPLPSPPSGRRGATMAGLPGQIGTGNDTRQVIETHLDGKRVGQLTPLMSERYSCLFTAPGEAPVCEGIIRDTGSSLQLLLPRLPIT
jgi:hypothetical protein